MVTSCAHANTESSPTVFEAFVAAWLMAASPTSSSVSLKLNATYEGVVRPPWSFATISARPFCLGSEARRVFQAWLPCDDPRVSLPAAKRSKVTHQTPTHEYVVPRSMPTDSPPTPLERQHSRLPPRQHHMSGL